MTENEQDQRRPLWIDLILLTFCTVVFVTMVLLGNWQVQRLGWKKDLIAAVDARAFGDPVPAPQGPVTADGHQYLRVALTGTYDHSQTREVKALTELGAGDWILTPLVTDTQTVWVNRGFLPSYLSQNMMERPGGAVTITGLLRITEQGGTIMESNDPAAERWVSRDVAALSLRAGIDSPAPYFVDADHHLLPHAWPRGGLTIIDFPNNHLQYALTWYAMALLFGGAMVFVIYDRLRGRAGAQGSLNSIAAE